MYTKSTFHSDTMEKWGGGHSCVLNRMLRAGLFCYVTFGQRLRKIRKHSGAHVVSDKQSDNVRRSS